MSKLAVDVLIRGAGDLASGVACALYAHGCTRVIMLETATPMAVRRLVSFSEAVYDGSACVEGLTAVRVAQASQLSQVFEAGQMAVMVDQELACLSWLEPEVLVDAVVAKRNLGTRPDMAGLVLALGPGFRAPDDAHAVIETNRGPLLGHIYWTGSAEPNTGIPAPVLGIAGQRVLRAPCAGRFESQRRIGEVLCAGDTVGFVDAKPVLSPLAGVLRGLIRPGVTVGLGTKLGDVDPRADVQLCSRISDKARALGLAVVKAVSSRKG